MTNIYDKVCGCPGIGLVLAVGSALFFSSQTLLVAKLHELHPMEVTFSRFAVIGVLTVPILLYCKESFVGAPEERLSLWIRAVLGCFSMIFLYYSLHNMPLGDATVIYMTSPVFVGVLAFFILKESCGIFETVSTIIMLIAVVFIAQPPFLFGAKAEKENDKPVDSMQRIWASLSGLVGAIFHASVHISLRTLKKVHFATILFTYSIWGMLQSGVFAYILGAWTIPKAPIAWAYIVGVGAFSVCALSCLTIALKTENAGSVSVLRSSDLLFAFIWEMIFLNEYPNAWTICGACLVMTCVLAYGFRKWYRIRKMAGESDEEKPMLPSTVKKVKKKWYQCWKIENENDIVEMTDDGAKEVRRWFEFWKRSVKEAVKTVTDTNENAEREKTPILGGDEDGGAKKWYQPKNGVLENGVDSKHAAQDSNCISDGDYVDQGGADNIVEIVESDTDPENDDKKVSGNSKQNVIEEDTSE